MSDEDLNDSPLFSLFLSSGHYSVAASQQLIVAVPSAASPLPRRPATRDMLESHILRKSPYFQHQYVTLNGKSVLLSDSSLQCKSGFAEPRTVQVTGQELYYDDDFHSFQVLRISLPLEGKVSPDFLRQLERLDGEDRGLERRSLAHHERLIARLTGDPIVPATGGGGSGAGQHSNVFVSVYKFVWQFNASYVLVKGFIEHAGLKVSDACARLREDVAAKAKAKGTDVHLVKRSVVELQMAVESLVMAAVYKKLFSGLCELYGREEERTQRHIRRMRGLTQAQLGIREDIQCHPHVAMALLSQLPGIPTVALKLAQLEDVSRALTQAVKDHAREGAREEAKDRDRERDTVLSAEDMIPLTLYTVLHSELQHVQAHLQLFHHFPLNRSVGGCDHLQVHLANFQAACQIIDTGDAGAGEEAEEEVDDGFSRRSVDASALTESKVPLSGESSLTSSLAAASLLSSSSSRGYGHGGTLSTSSSLGSLSSSHRNRSPSSSPQPPLFRGGSLRHEDGSLPSAQSVPRSSRPPLSRPSSSALPSPYDDSSSASADSSVRRTARSRTQRPTRHATQVTTIARLAPARRRPQAEPGGTGKTNPTASRPRSPPLPRHRGKTNPTRPGGIDAISTTPAGGPPGKTNPTAIRDRGRVARVRYPDPVNWPICEVERHGVGVPNPCHPFDPFLLV